MKTKKTIEDFSTEQMTEFSQKQLLSMQGGNRVRFSLVLVEGGYSTFTPLECSSDEVQDKLRKQWDGVETW